MKRFNLLAMLSFAIFLLANVAKAQTHEYVDLGLPTGTLWATENLNADNTKDFFGWAATSSKTYADAPYMNWTTVDEEKVFSDPTKYNATDNKIYLESSDDAATQLWGSEWRTPTKAEFEELISNCTISNSDDNLSTIFTGPNGNRIILPKNRFRDEDNDWFDGNGYYWTNEVDNSTTSNYFKAYAAASGVDRAFWHICSLHRNTGAYIRAVKVQKAETQKPVTVNLCSNEGVTLNTAGLSGTITWTNTSAAIATVDQQGHLSAVAAGTTTITATAGDRSITYNVTISSSVKGRSGIICVDGFYYTVSGTAATLTYATTNYNSYSGDVVVPSSVSFCGTDYEVTSIDSYAFRNCIAMTSVVVPNSVTSIPGSAFYGCSALESMTLPFVGGSATATSASPNTLFGFIFGNSSYTGGVSTTQYYSTGSSSNKSYYIPASLKDVTITGGNILYGAFSYCSGLTSVTIPNSATSIGERAFYYCKVLTSVTIPNSVTNIGSSAFSGCTSLTTLNYNAKNATVSTNTSSLSFPSSITALNIGEGVESIPAYLAYNFSKISSVTIPNSVTNIGSSAFSGCTSLTTLNYNAKNATVSTNTSSLSFPSSITALNIGEGVESIPAYLSYNLNKLSSLIVPGSVTSIGAYGLNTNSENLKTITLESSSIPSLAAATGVHTYPVIYVPVELLDYYLDAENWSAHSGQFIPIGAKTEYEVTIEADNLMSALHVKIGEDNLRTVESLKVSGTINSYDIMIMRNKMSNLKHLDLEDVTIVANDYEYYTGISSKENVLTGYFFSTKIETLKLPKSITQIEANALSGMNKLTSIAIPNSVTSIGESAFSGCSGLTSVTVPNSVTSIGESAFSGCSGLEAMTLPFVGRNASATTASSLFGYIFGTNSYTGGTSTKQYYYSSSSITYYIPTSLKSVTITGGSLPQGAFSYCSGLTSVTIRNSATSIGERAFYYCKGLTSVTIPNSVTSIGQSAFEYCTGLTSLTIPNSLASIGYGTFYSCPNLANIYINDIVNWCKCGGLKYLMNNGYYAKHLYVNGEKCENLIIPEGVEYISSYAFSKCSDLTSVTIPNSVTSTGDYAFSDCSGMTSVTIPQDSKISSISNYTFSGCSKLKKMSLPVSVTSIGGYAFQNCSAMTELKIPSSIHSVGASAFEGCTSLNDVYTYTIEPQSINQNTFSTWKTAILHVPAVSYYNYYYNTQWSQFLKLVNFDEPYDYAFIEKDYTMNTDNTGILRGDPLFDVWAGGAFMLNGALEQGCRELHLKCNNDKWASLIPHANNFNCVKLYIDIDVDKDKWYAFTFPFDVDLNDIEKEGDYVFRRYDGSMRAADGSGGWRSVEGNTLTANKGYIFRTNQAGTLSVPVSSPNFNPADKDLALETNASSKGAEHAGWNFIGNPYTSYYNMNDVTYSAPVVIFNGTGYEAYRPGDDDYMFHPFQAFFVQKPNNVTGVGFGKDNRISYLESQDAEAASKAKARRAKRLNNGVSRSLINLTLSCGEEMDKTRVVYNDRQSMDYEAECDAAKFISTDAMVQLYSIDENGTKYAINERPMKDGYVMLGYVANTEGELTLAAPRMDAEIVIYDRQEDVYHNFADGDYKFTTEAGTFNDRFAIIKATDDATAISNINADGENSAPVYDLNGRRLNQKQKGVNIQNGKKVVVR